MKLNEAKSLEENISTVLAYVPYDIHLKHEYYYHNLFIVWLKTLGFDIQGEVHNNIGSADFIYKDKNFVVVGECKFNANEEKLEKELNIAFKQIYKNKYYKAYANNEVKLLAIAFSREKVLCKFKL
ncbi:PD-(D/E)XK nuclease domain-containing protein [Methanobrevibacter curvatus]|uniref:DUF234 domain-containing protein n=1 Tax=Methanobrevibacter curvatus TaxID=49547 RepID=A0A166AVS9_9EURY|nr:PD-(D/E)XK nuclease domain-containing protein [Methanobrevibacter curvatus]KZX12531.1 hypothetical protein MBCUR_10210 [Methanobrevibacter curvatus]